MFLELIDGIGEIVLLPAAGRYAYGCEAPWGFRAGGPPSPSFHPVAENGLQWLVRRHMWAMPEPEGYKPFRPFGSPSFAVGLTAAECLDEP
jgi:hypothetical protein